MDGILVIAPMRESAEALLRSPDFGIAEVSTSLGYEDPANFGRACRRWFGMAPGRYRQQLLTAAQARGRKARRPRARA